MSREKNLIPHLKGKNFDEAFKNVLGLNNSSKLKVSLDNISTKKRKKNKKEL